MAGGDKREVKGRSRKARRGRDFSTEGRKDRKRRRRVR